MGNSMKYLGWINSESFDKFKEKKGIFPMNLRVYFWIKFLADEDNFKDYFGSEVVEDKEPITDKRKFAIDVDCEDWPNFKYNCKNIGVSANWALNTLIADFGNSKRDSLFEFKIEM